MKGDNLSDLDKIGLAGLSGRSDEEPPGRISGLQVFVLFLLLIFIAMVVFI